MTAFVSLRVCVFAKPQTFLMYLFKLQVTSNLAIFNELHLLSVRKIHLFEHVFVAIAKNSSSSREVTSALDFRMTTPWSSRARFVETQTASVPLF